MNENQQSSTTKNTPKPLDIQPTNLLPHQDEIENGFSLIANLLTLYNPLTSTNTKIN